jgi:hypothetical protein
LLGPVEAVQLIDEQNGPPAGLLQFGAGFQEQIAHLLDPGGGGVDLAKMALAVLGDDVGQRGFTCARRAVEDHGTEAVGLEHAPQQLAGAEEMVLADEFIDRARPHARGQRLGLAEVGFVDVVEQVDGGDLREMPTNQIDKSSRIRPGIRIKSRRLRVRSVRLWARATAPIFKSFVPMRRRIAHNC